MSHVTASYQQLCKVVYLDYRLSAVYTQCVVLFL